MKEVNHVGFFCETRNISEDSLKCTFSKYNTLLFFSADSPSYTFSSISCCAPQSSTSCRSRKPTAEKTLHRGGARREEQRATRIPGDKQLLHLYIHLSLVSACFYLSHPFSFLNAVAKKQQQKNDLFFLFCLLYVCLCCNLYVCASSNFNQTIMCNFCL